MVSKYYINLTLPADFFTKKPTNQLQVVNADVKSLFEIVDKSRRHGWEVKDKYSKSSFMMKKLFKNSELDDGIPQSVIRELTSILALHYEHIIT